MGPKAIVLLVICFAAMSVAGCMTHSPEPAGTTMPTSLLQTTAAPAVSPVQVAECTRAEDCVPAECCHPASCIPGPKKKPCNLMCTASCEGPIDCGAGSCGCVNGKCSVVPATSVSSAPRKLTAITITASPLRYSPIMSSTPGIGLEPVISGFTAQDATFTWNATYGKFLSWNSPDFRVNQLGNSVINHEKLYWSFTDIPSSPETPVILTVTATNPASGHLLGNSTVTLAWEGNTTVTVKTAE